MDQQEKQDVTDNRPRSDEDLPVNEERAGTVKGGAGIKTVRFKAGKDLEDLG